MMDFKNQYLELLSQTQNHLLQEYSRDSLQTTDLETYNYFLAQKIVKKEPPVQMTQPTKQAFPAPRQTQPISAKPAVVIPRKIDDTPEIAEPVEAAPSALVSPPKNSDLSDIQKILAERCPTQRTTATIPTAAQAAETQVIVLTSSEPPEQQEVLKNLSKAIQQRLAPAELRSAHEIDSKNEWEALLTLPSLRLIILSNKALQGSPKLASFYEDSQKQPIEKATWHVLPDVAVYLEQPNLKIVLWKTLCQILGVASK